VVLVVEDELLVRMDALDMISDAGFEVLEAANADEALALLAARDDICVVFSDVDLPGSMDGLKLVRAVAERWPPVRLVLTSGHVPVTAALLPKGGRFIPKPYRAEEVARTIHEMVA
jgi:DNA-binding NtrC family response regulator